mgnify:CR=1 FL=1
MIDLQRFITEKKIKKMQISDLLGVKPAYLSAILSGKRPLSKEKVNILINQFGEDILQYTLPDVIIEHKTSDGPQFLPGDYEKTNIGVPYYEDLDVTGSMITSFEDYNEVPTFRIDYRHFNDCDAYLPVVGDSMLPKFVSGDIIAVKQMKSLETLLWGETYLVITNQNANSLRTIKDVHYHPDQSKIILRASNPAFAGDTIINKCDIVSIYIVKGKIKRNQL